jgi:hypothetical protein
MGTTTARKARKWLRQRKPVPDRVAALIVRCAEGGMKPGKILMSTDLYIQMAAAAAKSMDREIDVEDMPPALSISLGDHELKIVHDEEMPRATMHAKR